VPKLLFSLLAFPWVAGPASATLLELKGDFVQGGLVLGRTDPATKISLDGDPVAVTPDGRFVMGFGWDALETATFQSVAADGKQLVRKLKIRKRKYRIQRIDGLPSKMVTPSPAALQRIRAEGKVIRDARATFTPVAHFAGGFIWPAKGRISGAYGGQRILNGKPRRPHLRIDIAAPTGAQVVAAAPGRITLANRDMYFTGGTVIIDHGHGLSTVYSHLSAIDTKVGQMVKQGEGIGKVGSTGRSTGPHLDWRVNWFQERLDPNLLVGSMWK
jgi:hypothetical protein